MRSVLVFLIFLGARLNAISQSALPVCYKITHKKNTIELQLQLIENPPKGFVKSTVLKQTDDFPGEQTLVFIADSIRLGEYKLLPDILTIWGKGKKELKSLKSELLFSKGTTPDSVTFVPNAKGQHPDGVFVAWRKGSAAIINDKRNAHSGYNYDSVAPIGSYGMVPVQKNGKWGFYCKHELFPVVKPRFDSIGVFNYDTKAAPVKLDGRWLKLNLQGDLVGTLSESLKPFGKKWRYAIKNEHIVIDSIRVNSGQVIIGSVGTKMVLIRETGQVIYFDGIIPIRQFNKLIHYQVDSAGKHGIIDLWGYDMFPCKYDLPIYMTHFSREYILNLHGKLAIVRDFQAGKKDFQPKFLFDSVNVLEEPHQLTIVKIGQKYGLYNPANFDGSQVVYDEIIRGYGETYAGKKEGKFQLLNGSQKPVQADFYDEVIFSHAWIVKQGLLFGTVSNYGVKELPVKYDEIKPLDKTACIIVHTNGIYQIYSGNRLLHDSILSYVWFGTSQSLMINSRQGRQLISCMPSGCDNLIPTNFDSIQQIAENCFLVRIGNQVGITYSGNWVIEPDSNHIQFVEETKMLLIEKNNIVMKLDHPMTQQILALAELFRKPPENKPLIESTVRE